MCNNSISRLSKMNKLGLFSVLHLSHRIAPKQGKSTFTDFKAPVAGWNPTPDRGRDGTYFCGHICHLMHSLALTVSPGRADKDGLAISVLKSRLKHRDTLM